MSSTDLLVKTTISVTQIKANTQAEVIHCTEGQKYERTSNFNKASTSSAQAKSILTSTDLIKALYDDQDMIDPSGEQECLQQEIEYEVKAYLKFKVKADDTDILKWWKDHNDNFPNVSFQLPIIL